MSLRESLYRPREPEPSPKPAYRKDNGWPWSVRKVQKRVLQEFHEEHDKYILKHDPSTGECIDWKISVYWHGHYDEMNGYRTDGEWKVSIQNECAVWRYDKERHLTYKNPYYMM